jgi:hypothetical protein
MTKDQKQLLGNVIAIVLLIAFVAYGRYAVTDISNTLVGVRKSDAMFLSKMVRENWDGIKSIPEEKKKVLLKNLDPQLAGIDIRVMSQLSLIWIYLIGFGLILNRLIVIGKEFWTRRREPRLR